MVSTRKVLTLVGLSVDIFATILIAAAVFNIHARLAKEGGVDRSVILAIHQERGFIVTGIVLLVSSFVLTFTAELLDLEA